ncbi:S24 family peptidase [Soonwooa purpurea]
MMHTHYLERLIISKQMNPKSFAESLGYKRADIIYNVLNGKNGLSSKLAKLIVSVYNDVNYEWLISGEGEMLLTKDEIMRNQLGGKSLNANYAKNKDGVMMEESEIYNNLKDTVTQVDSDNYMEVEYRDLSVAAGPLNRTDEKAPRKTMLVPREYEKGEYLVVRVDGPSMDDGSTYSIPEGAKILVRRYYLDNGDKLPIRGNLFVIDAKEGQALKQIVEHNTELGYVRCHSYNPEFKDYNIPLEEVYGFYIFRKIVAFRPPVRDIEN